MTSKLLQELRDHEAYDEGRRAYADGWDEAGNPYPKGGSEWKNWDEGWKAEQQESPRDPTGV